MLRAQFYCAQLLEYYLKDDDHWFICHNLALHYLKEIDLDILKPVEEDE